ncbi:response regulator transcription factor [Pseudoduganella chitinolytica]|uniref:Helix-turn-helix transcriptional regulator n=1 Tax=Pseudoduganella chitinolytica TaxID=34070 RepID=A0ABY8BMR0_9BURK|nr:helix-turn-helix transcriptional regulator [Pseudoduganella chitinolytica]WEF35589.1 helix-turn-helix transcriptional regulator [Pseudoduganella chitinolytica]
MLQYFSTMMLEMYEAAEQAAYADCSSLYRAMLARVLSFDIAELGCGFVGERRQCYRPAVTADPVVLSSSFHLGLPPPVVCNAVRLQQLFDPGRLLGYAQGQSVRQLLLLGSREAPGQSPHWLLLGRQGRRAFSAGAAIYIIALWPHLLRCKQLCQRRYLAKQTSAWTKAGFAVISAHSAVEACDGAFECLAQLEWPGCLPGTLPAGALADLRIQGKYEGRFTRWSIERGPGEAFLCRVIERMPADLLTPAEAVTARHYAQGRTHGEIAALLGVSSNTVRTHIAHVFSKLDIHRKSELPARLR